jgi:signal peptide peptidase SppA
MDSILESFGGRYWYATDDMMDTIRSTFNGMTASKLADMQASLRDRMQQEGQQQEDLPWRFTKLREDGMAVVKIHGAITRRPSILSLIFGGTSTEEMTQAFRAMASDDRVKGVVLDVNSNGGSVQGVEMATEALRELRAAKPVTSIANDNMNSAAYHIGSAADEIFVTPSSTVGSIGVYAMLVNRAEALEDAGIKVKIVRAGEFKAKPNSWEQLDKKDVQLVQENVNKFYEDFVSAVATNRGMTYEEALALADGTVEIGANAIDRGLAHQEGYLQTAMDEMKAAIEEADAQDELVAAQEDYIASLETQVDDLMEQNDTLQDEVDEMREEVEQAAALQAELEAEQKQTRIEAMVSDAIESGKIGAKQEDHYLQMADTHGVEVLEMALDGLEEGQTMPTEETDLGDEPVAETDSEAPQTEHEKRVMARFPSLREKYDLHDYVD